MKISNNTVVTITYKLQQKDAEGEVIQHVKKKEPFVFLFGYNQVLPDFEKHLINEKVGSTFEFSIKSDDGYGPRDPQAVTDLPINLFMKDGKLLDYVKVGNYLPMNDKEGNALQGLVMEVNEETETIKMDFNHPMAGIDLFFSGKVIEVREATAEEIEHGHAHGLGGHQH